MRKLVLATCLLSVTASFAAAVGISSTTGGKIITPVAKQQGHAPEMTGTAMAVAGVVVLGGYLMIRRRISWQS
jgi:hypothetical protein